MVKRQSKKSDTFTATEVGVLIEDLRSQFRVFGERMDIFDRKLKDVRSNQAWTLERVTGLEINFNLLKNDVSDLKTDVTGLKSTTARILEDTTSIKKTIAGHENRVARLEKSVFN